MALVAEAKRTGFDLTTSNAVWIATALLHRQFPKREAFIYEEILRLVVELNLTNASEESVLQHVRQHSVANKKPQPNTVCMLFDPGGGTRRLFRRGDVASAGRNENRTHPEWGDLPAKFADLRSWYEDVWNKPAAGQETDPLLRLAGTWKGEPADQYVARLRAGWEERG
jgi:hypothetical protein